MRTCFGWMTGTSCVDLHLKASVGVVGTSTLISMLYRMKAVGLRTEDPISKALNPNSRTPTGPRTQIIGF